MLSTTSAMSLQEQGKNVEDNHVEANVMLKLNVLIESDVEIRVRIVLINERGGV